MPVHLAPRGEGILVRLQIKLGDVTSWFCRVHEQTMLVRVATNRVCCPACWREQWARAIAEARAPGFVASRGRGRPMSLRDPKGRFAAPHDFPVT